MSPTTLPGDATAPSHADADRPPPGHRDGLPAPARAFLDAGGRAVGSAFAALAVARGGKPVHPAGAVHEATLSVPGSAHAPPAPLLRRRAEHRALVRFSRSLGVPRPIPDLLGMSLRILDAHGDGRHQDFLLVTSVDAPVLHHVFLPARDVWERPYSSSLPYRAGRKRFLVGARALPGPRPDGEDELDRLDAAARAGGLSFALAVAPLMGRFRTVGELRVGARLPPDLDGMPFSPWNTGGGIEPAGLLNRLRGYAYPRAQAARSQAVLRPGAAERPAPGGNPD